ncbi:hypothetical protein PYCCODRAFT_1406927 [Trametes coccinea BRFM310]|uniref:ZZ-type domain-containing protein n=1 Tax=Trametes coccinea (strain BRFM310) TaxID=1353009 RepID=A0A1Y2IXV4_TRAC3|nr:hypothetical protein PYCCODRAFT_1406927 [Trametes coccinea BRFM310]
MSAAGSEYGGSTYERSEPRPDKPLVVKCIYEDRGNKKISYSNARACTYDVLRKQIEKTYGLNSTPFHIAYVDDDTETIYITNEADLTEAINYFKPTVSDDAPLSSAASILSGRSFRQSKITLKLNILVDYDGISLSDTGSLVSLEEYRSRNGSGFSLSHSSMPPHELEDDAITVSSKDVGSKYQAYLAGQGPKTIVAGPSREPLIDPSEHWEATTVSSVSHTLSSNAGRDPVPREEDVLARFPEDPSLVFARLKLQEERLGFSPGVLNGTSALQTERGANWLREQSAHLTGLNGDGISLSEFSLEDSVSLELEQNEHGNYRYTLTGSGGSIASQSVRDYNLDDGASSGLLDATDSVADPAEADVDSRPTSMQATQFSHPHRSSNPFSAPGEEQSVASDFIHPDIPREVLFFLEGPLGPPPDPTSCSKCGVVLDMVKYVCSTCGEKKPLSSPDSGSAGSSKGKTRAIDIQREHAYPPFYHSPSASSSTIIGSGRGSSSGSSGSSEHHPSRSMSDSTVNMTLQPLPTILHHSPSGSSNGSGRPTPSAPGMEQRLPQGYELCSDCVQEYGVEHSLQLSGTPGSSPGPGTSPEDAERALARWRRTAPSQKGVLRHAYIEQSWTHKGWADVEQGGTGTCRCSTCNTVITSHRYKCARCDDFNLCRACYRQVYEVHPAHAFLQVPDKQGSSQSSTVGMIDQARLTVSMEEPSMTHVGVHCAHCMQEIVGARFHCAVCDNIDICQNCDAAGLPGNMDSPDGGHVSSHIMIKIPHPIPSADLQSTSQMALKLWTRDGPHLQATGTNGHGRRNSFGSAYSHTVLGTGTRADTGAAALDHGVACDGCAQPIVGVRYQCANCPSYPKSVSLCERCEARSYALHDPWHVFFKLPRPLDRPLVLQPPLPRLYKVPAGPAGGRFNLADPKGYLRNLTHRVAVCDRCMSHIRGEWFHCAYCPKDLCDSCAEVDTHDPAHLFIVFKSSVDMGIFRRRFMNEEDPSRSPPLIPFPVYNS